MPNIEKLKKNGQVIYPVTTPQAVIDQYGRNWAEMIHPPVGTSVPTGGLLPNVLYRLGTLTSAIEITLATPVDSTIENGYKFTFDTDATLVGVTFPSVTQWQGNCLQNGIPVLAASKHYEVSIEGGYGIIIEF